MTDIAVVSVVICTHNPRSEYLQRTLDGLRTQTLPLQQWELLVIDNASREPVADRFDISWHPNGRYLLESKLGLTPARLCGIAAAKAELLIFVDDDNILDPDYLEQSWSIAKDYPFLGAWAGQCLPDYIDRLPDKWCMPFLSCLALVEIERDFWSNFPSDDFRCTPFGAGLVVRRTVALRYAQELANASEFRRSLDRRGTELSGSGDLDLAFTACDLNLGIGRFHRLRLIHIIPGSRLSHSYITRLVEGSCRSTRLLKALRGLPCQDARPSFLRRIKHLLTMMLGGDRAKQTRVLIAAERGNHLARIALEKAHHA